MDLSGKMGLYMIVTDERRHYLSCKFFFGVILSYFGLRIHPDKYDNDNDHNHDEKIYFPKVSSVIPFRNHKLKPI